MTKEEPVLVSSLLTLNEFFSCFIVMIIPSKHSLDKITPFRTRYSKSAENGELYLEPGQTSVMEYFQENT